MARAFISYKSKVDPDQRIAAYLDSYLSERNHDIFIQTKIQAGQTWADVVDAGLRSADYLIVLVSRQSVNSEMVIEEVRRGAHLKASLAKPVILPVQLAENLEMPYDVGAKLNRIQHLRWLTDGDEVQIAAKLHDIMTSGEDPPAEGTRAQPTVAAVSTDGTPIENKDELVAPRPAFDPSWLKALEGQGGAVSLDSPFYVTRSHDAVCKQRVGEKGRTVLIQGGRQTGKTSLLARLYQHAGEQSIPAAFIDFQGLDDNALASLDSLLRCIADQLHGDLSLNNSPDAIWATASGSKQKMTKYLEDEAIGNRNQKMVLLMDEVDRVFSRPQYYNDFFALIRYWHSRRVLSKRLEWLTIVLSFSMEDSAFITNPNQSPFNVGEKFFLADFTKQEIEDLNFKHGSPIATAEMDRVLSLFGGHPFLVRQALYVLVSGGITLADLEAEAANDDGPFGSHLQYYLLRMSEHADLKQALKSVLLTGACPDDKLFYRLRSIGLVRGHDRLHAALRCGLYAAYFGARL